MRIFLFLLLCFMPSLVLAQSAPPSFTADDAVAQAIKNNPRLSAASRDVLAARSGVGSARAFANPQILFTPAVSGPGGSDTELLVQQPLELNGTRAARTGVASAQLRGTQAQALVTLRDLVFDTKTAYYELARAQERLSLAREALQLTEEFDRIARRQVELGARPGIEVTQTSIEAARAKQQVTLAESEATAARAILNTQMGRNPAELLGTLSLPAYAPQPLDQDVLLGQALTARAEIQVDEATADALRQEARLARAEGRPDLVPQFRAGSITRSFSDYGFGIGISLPLFDYGSRRARIRQAEESARAQTARLAATRNLVRQEVAQALARLRAAETVLQTYPQGVLEQSRQLLDASRKGFEEGKTSIVALLEAQRTYRAVQNEYANAQADYALARAAVERAAGAVSASLLPGSPLPRRSK